jgi:hypothetical protein
MGPRPQVTAVVDDIAAEESAFSFRVDRDLHVGMCEGNMVPSRRRRPCLLPLPLPVEALPHHQVHTGTGTILATSECLVEVLGKFHLTDFRLLPPPPLPGSLFSSKSQADQSPHGMAAANVMATRSACG